MPFGIRELSVVEKVSAKEGAYRLVVVKFLNKLLVSVSMTSEFGTLLPFSRSAEVLVCCETNNHLVIRGRKGFV